MKVIFLLLAVVLLVFGCGKREDPHYFACNDGSGSDKCRELDQNELAEYIESERYSDYRRVWMKSRSTGGDRGVIQTFILNQLRFKHSDHGGFNFDLWDERVFNKQDRDLECAVQSYFGILDESGSDKRSFRLRISGRKWPDSGRCNLSGYLYQLEGPGYEVELYNDNMDRVY